MGKMVLTGRSGKHWRRVTGLLTAVLMLVSALTPSVAAAPAAVTAPVATSGADIPIDMMPPGALNTQYAKLYFAAKEKYSYFADLPRHDWAYGDVREMFAAGIIGGDTAATEGAGKPVFRPDDPLTREECAVIISRLSTILDRGTADGTTATTGTAAAGDMADAPADTGVVFADVARTSWAYPHIETAKAYLTDFTRLNGETYFMPQSPTERGTLVTALMKLTGGRAATADQSLLAGFADEAGLRRGWRPYVALAVEKAILNGHDDGSLRLNESVTRKEACVLVARSLAAARFQIITDPVRTAVYMPYLDSGFYDLYFDDAVFVGDSITMEMMIHIRNQRKEGIYPLGDCRFCAQYVYGLRVAAGNFNPDNKNVSYNGVAAPLEDCLQRMGAKDVYLMLGMNDHAGANLPDSIQKYETIVDKIMSKNPDARVFIQFLTPVTKRREGQLLNNANTDKFNRAIVELCERRGIDWIDINSPLKDNQNALVYEWSSDRFAHLNKSGYAAWFNALREFVCVKYLSGEWAPPASANAPESYPGRYVYMD